MTRANSHPRRRAVQRTAGTKHSHVARDYERGHAAPFSPESSEISQPDSPAMEEALGRDVQDGLSGRRRKERGGPRKREGRSPLRVERILH